MVQRLLEDMVAQLLIQKPDDPVPHIVQFLEEQNKTHQEPLSKTEKIELHQMREELQRL